MTDTKISFFRRSTAETWALVLVSLVFTGLLIFPGLKHELGPTLARAHQSWKVALVILPAGALLLLLAPVGLLRVWLNSRNDSPRGPASGLVALTLIFSYALADLALYSRFGRHLTDLIAYLKLPKGADAAGGFSTWFGDVAVIFIWSGVSAFLLHYLSHRASIHLARLRPSSVALLGLIGALLWIALCASLWLLPPLMPDGFSPRLTASLPLRVGATMESGHYEPRDPQLRRLQASFRDTYRTLFPYLFRKTQNITLNKRPNAQTAPKRIAIVVAESLRWEQLSPERMPRLWEWSKRGLRGERHYAATNHSESGLFVIFYGESAIRYNSTLDHKSPPTLCTLIHTVDFQCGYYTGHPKKWMRREEFLNEKTMDIFSHNDSDDWNDWDLRALSRSAKDLHEKEGLFSLTFLMSSHFEYRYPKEYERHTPANLPRTRWLPGETKPDEYVSSRNRYMNVTAYLDDLVSDYLEKLDLETTLFIFTGDHGESTGEDGRFGHGYGFSDPLTRVPFFMLGPGIQPGLRRSLSSHHDILPTVLYALGQKTRTSAIGRALQLPEEREERSLLSSYTTVGRPIINAVLLHKELRVRLRFDPIQPIVDLLGFEDEMGRVKEVSLTDADVVELSRVFQEQLQQAGTQVQ